MNTKKEIKDLIKRTGKIYSSSSEEELHISVSFTKVGNIEMAINKAKNNLEFKVNDLEILDDYLIVEAPTLSECFELMHYRLDDKEEEDQIDQNLIIVNGITYKKV